MIRPTRIAGYSPAWGEQLALLGSGENGAPLAFLNYHLFDRQFNKLNSAVLRVPTSAAITEASFTGEHVKLSVTLDITQAGYLMANLFHDAVEDIDIYWDDFTQPIVVFVTYVYQRGNLNDN